MSGPAPGLVLDNEGDLFGVTTNGGLYKQGTIFEIAAGQHNVTTLTIFNYDNGAYPEGGGLVIDAAGDLFGTTTVGGVSGGNLANGTVFELPVDRTRSRIWQFSPAPTEIFRQVGSSPMRRATCSA